MSLFKITSPANSDIDDCTENLHNCSHECVNLDGGL